MTIPTQLVLQALLEDPQRELYGIEIGTAAGLPSGTVHPILASTWAVRDVLDEVAVATNGEGTMHIVTRRPLTCLLLRWHKWQIVSTEDGSSHYGKCRKCGKESWSRFRAALSRTGTSSVPRHVPGAPHRYDRRSDSFTPGAPF